MVQRHRRARAFVNGVRRRRTARRPTGRPAAARRRRTASRTRARRRSRRRPATRSASASPAATATSTRSSRASCASATTSSRTAASRRRSSTTGGFDNIPGRSARRSDADGLDDRLGQRRAAQQHVLERRPTATSRSTSTGHAPGSDLAGHPDRRRARRTTSGSGTRPTRRARDPAPTMRVRIDGAPVGPTVHATPAPAASASRSRSPGRPGRTPSRPPAPRRRSTFALDWMRPRDVSASPSTRSPSSPTSGSRRRSSPTVNTPYLYRADPGGSTTHVEGVLGATPRRRPKVQFLTSDVVRRRWPARQRRPPSAAPRQRHDRRQRPRRDRRRHPVRPRAPAPPTSPPRSSLRRPRAASARASSSPTPTTRGRAPRRSRTTRRRLATWMTTAGRRWYKFPIQPGGKVKVTLAGAGRRQARAASTSSSTPTSRPPRPR